MESPITAVNITEWTVYCLVHKHYKRPPDSVQVGWATILTWPWASCLTRLAALAELKILLLLSAPEKRAARHLKGSPERLLLWFCERRVFETRVWCDRALRWANDPYFSDELLLVVLMKRLLRRVKFRLTVLCFTYSKIKLVYAGLREGVRDSSSPSFFFPLTQLRPPRSSETPPLQTRYEQVGWGFLNAKNPNTPKSESPIVRIFFSP